MSGFNRQAAGSISVFANSDATVANRLTLASLGSATSRWMDIAYGGSGAALYVYVGYDTGTSSDYTITYDVAPTVTVKASDGTFDTRYMANGTTGIYAAGSPNVVTSQTGANKTWKVYSLSLPACQAVRFTITNNLAVACTAHSANQTGLEAYLVYGG